MMLYDTMQYTTPIGRLLLAATDTHLVGAWFMGQKYFGAKLPEGYSKAGKAAPLAMAACWLDDYFAGKQPGAAALPLSPAGSEFRQMVWEVLCSIPYGRVMTYGQIAKMIAKKVGKDTMSAQAVGGAVGHNPISIIIPCHRVVGSDGSLTGYAGGVEKKLWLLQHEEGLTR